jgi:hypothetical protein
MRFSAGSTAKDTNFLITVRRFEKTIRRSFASEVRLRKFLAVPALFAIKVPTACS